MIVPLLRSSGPQVQLVEGSLPHFTEETTALLRLRLQTITLVLSLLVIFALLTTLTFPGLPLRLAVVVFLIGLQLILRSNWKLTESQLRWIELGTLAAVSIQATYMPNVLILERARAGDASTVIMDFYFIVGVWAMLIMSYGLLIPNRWLRTLIVSLPMCILPYVNLYLLFIYEPLVKQAFDTLHHGAPMPLTVAATIGGVYGAHIVNAIRRDAFKAQQFGQYRLVERLGAGGMGVVYRAEHQLLKRPCAIKLIQADGETNATAIARFEREVQATARLSHWNTVEVYDYGRTNEGVFYYVMELLPGLSLADLVEQAGPLPAGRAIYLLRQVCAGLREAHSLGLIHRDLKPANIFAAHRGGVDDVAKILDFGLVKTQRQENDPMITRQGVISGSPPYMSPEQAVSGDSVDPRSDIYSLGAVAYCLVVGRPPFIGQTALEMVIMHARDPVVPPSARNANVPPDLEQIILRCLEKKPPERFANVQELDAALVACVNANDWNVELAAEWWQNFVPPAPSLPMTKKKATETADSIPAAS